MSYSDIYLLCCSNYSNTQFSVHFSPSLYVCTYVYLEANQVAMHRTQIDVHIYWTYWTVIEWLAIQLKLYYYSVECKTIISTLVLVFIELIELLFPSWTYWTITELLLLLLLNLLNCYMYIRIYCTYLCIHSFHAHIAS